VILNIQISKIDYFVERLDHIPPIFSISIATGITSGLTEIYSIANVTRHYFDSSYTITLWTY
jgi:hypothetical protein